MEQRPTGIKNAPDSMLRCFTLFNQAWIFFSFLFYKKNSKMCFVAQCFRFEDFIAFVCDNKHFTMDEKLHQFATVLALTSIFFFQEEKEDRTREDFWVDERLWTQWVASTMHCFQPETPD